MVPVTILTGFLGSGKTTLLRKILTEFHGSRLAIIENEYGSENIDSDLLIEEYKEEIVELSNGCVCCTIRGDLMRSLLNLREKRKIGKLFFDRVIIETTGIANPGPICQTFFIDDKISEYYRLDAIITIVDAKHGMNTLSEEQESQKQVGFADRILISKKDLVDEHEYESLVSRLKKMNPRAPIFSVNFGKTDLSLILDVEGFNLNAILDIDPDFLIENSENSTCDFHSDNHENCAHKDDIGTFVFRSYKPFDSNLLEEFLTKIVKIYGPDLLRYKGILYMNGINYRMLFQGVHMMMGAEQGKQWLLSENPYTKMVFIGRRLPTDIFLNGLEKCLAL
ncbi:MAG: GTP-binding protein [Bordetella sp.]|nr:MAG: GTP-binding protein [Bordetella sp.]